MTTTDDPPAIGHNSPPTDAEILAEKLATKHKPVVAEVDALAARANLLPKTLRTEADMEAASQIVRDARAMEKRVETIRKDDQQPFTDALEVVRSFFRPHADRVDRIKSGVQLRADEYTAEKAAAAKRAAAEEARKAEEAAAEHRRKAEELAAAGKTAAAEKALDRAETFEDRAARATETVSASAADLTRTRGSGGTVSARQKWVHAIVDIDAIPMDKIRPYLKREHIDAAVKKFVDLGNRELPGVRIYEDVKANIR